MPRRRPHRRARRGSAGGRARVVAILDWQYQKTAAEHALRYLAGVRGISNAITLKPTVSTFDIKEKIHAAFERSAEIDADRVKIEARDGKVILRGTVRSWSEKNQAMNAAWSAPGVNAVENDLVVTP